MERGKSSQAWAVFSGHYRYARRQFFGTFALEARKQTDKEKAPKVEIVGAYEEIDPLIGDARRRASGALRGYRYQFLQTALAWLELGPKQRLYAESAEDFEEISAYQATAVQVKHRSLPETITLARNDALEALNNFWDIRSKNPGLTVLYQFLTNSRVGKERSSAFGQKTGIELWRLCQDLSLDECRPHLQKIRKFLLGQSHLSKDLLAFIRDSSDESLIGNLIKPFRWVTNEPSLEDSQQIIVDKLLSIFRPIGMSAQMARQVCRVMCDTIFEIATKSNPEPLTVEMLQEIVDRETTIPVRMESLLGGNFLSDLLKHGLEAVGSGEEVRAFQILASENLRLEQPILQESIWPRPKLEEEILCDEDTRFVSVIGSVGTGKTTTVLQAVRNKENVLWVQLRGLDVEDIRRKCTELSLAIEASDANPIVVLDDFQFDTDWRPIEGILSRLGTLIETRQGTLITISHSTLTPRLSGSFALGNPKTVALPAFSPSEICDALRTEGCPEGRIEGLSKLVLMQTQGHPQLVHARITRLTSLGFPQPRSADLVDSPKEIEDARSEALKLIQELLPENSRTLLYRLSVSIPPLSVEQIKNLAGKDEPITRGGEALLPLQDVWLEQPIPGRFCVSGLIRNIAQTVYSQAEIENIHVSIAQIMLSQGDLSIDEAAGAICHALVGRGDHELLSTIQGFLKAPEEVKRRLSAEIDWVLYVGSEPNASLPIDNRSTCRLFRVLQWEVAKYARPNRLGELFDIIEQEFAGENRSLEESYPKLLFCYKSLAEPGFALKPDQVFRLSLDLIDLFEFTERMQPAFSLETTLDGGPLQSRIELFRALLTIGLLADKKTLECLDDFTAALASLGDDQMHRLLALFETDDGELRMIFDRIWTNVDPESPEECDKFLRELNRIVQLARRIEAKPWARAALRVKSAIYNETLGDPGEALAVLDQGKEEFGDSNALRDQRAIVHFNEQRYEDALAIWDDILSRWTDVPLEQDLRPLLAYRNAAMAAAKLGQNDKCESLLKVAVDRSKPLPISAFTVGLRADWAFVLYEHGNISRALQELWECLQGLGKLRNDPEALEDFAVHKWIGNLLAWMDNPHGKFMRPTVGLCSSPAPDENMRSLPRAPIEFSFNFLYRIALKHGEAEIASRVAPILRNSPYAILRLTVAEEDVKEAINNRQYDAVIPKACKQAYENQFLFERQDFHAVDRDPKDLSVVVSREAARTGIAPAIVAAILYSKTHKDNPISVFSYDSSLLEIEDENINLFICEYRKLMDGTESQNARVLADEDIDIGNRLIAAATIIGETGFRPEILTYAQILLLNNTSQLRVLWEVGGRSMFELTKADWQRMLSNPFQLKSPNIYSDAVQEACSITTGSWNEAASIIIKALPMVELRVPVAIRENVQMIADGISSSPAE